MRTFLTFLVVTFLSTFSFSYEIKEGFLRTPDDRFENLEDYPFKPNYMVVDLLRINYIDEGPKDADAIILIQGEAKGRYLYR